MFTKGQKQKRPAGVRLRAMTPSDLRDLMNTVEAAGDLIIQSGMIMRQGFGVEWQRRAVRVNRIIQTYKFQLAEAIRLRDGHDVQIDAAKSNSNSSGQRTIF